MDRERKLILSPTKIKTFFECKTLYRFIYVDRIGRFYKKPKPYFSLGASLHAAIQDFHDKGGAETQTSEDLEKHLEQAWISAGYSTPDEEKRHWEAAEKSLKNYFKSAAARKSRTIFTERTMSCDMGDFKLKGRIDRIDEWPTGELEIIDYKSGRFYVTAEQIFNDLAMGIYQIITRSRFPDRRVLSTIHCLRTGQEATVDFSDEQIIQTVDIAKDAALAIMSTSWTGEPRPEWRDGCEYCDFSDVCRRYVGL